MFDDKKYLFQRLPMRLSSSPKLFTDFMHFPSWAIKNDLPELYFVKVPKDSINLNNFRKDGLIVLDKNNVSIATLFHYLDDILGGHKTRSGAFKQVKHSEEILKKWSLQTKLLKAKPP